MLLIVLVFASLYSQSTAINLGCTYSVLTVWQISNLYNCGATVFIFDNGRFVTSVSSNHQAGRSNRHVQSLMITNQNIGFVPRGIGKFFPNLESLHLSNAGVEDLSYYDIESLPMLRQLDLISNRIQVVQADLFWYNPRIQYVSFHGNPVRSVDASVFDFRYDLVTLNFPSTSCINANAANNRAAVINLVSRLNIECPPTTQRTSEALTHPPSKKFEENIDISP